MTLPQYCVTILFLVDVVQSCFVCSLLLCLDIYGGYDHDGMLPPKLAVIFRHLVKRSTLSGMLEITLCQRNLSKILEAIDLALLL